LLVAGLDFTGLGRLALVAGTSISVVTSLLTSAGYWLLFIAFGWPLFRDINRALGIDLREYSPRKVFAGLRKSNQKENSSSTSAGA
jgi:hypothetical protein